MFKRKVFICFILLFLSIIFIVLLKNVDVKCNAVNDSCIGFSTINQYFFNKIGLNMFWYIITDYLGLFPILLSSVYAFIGFKQFIKRKVNREIIILGIFYVLVVLVYLLFEKYIINYRPVLIDGLLEVSFPSSHTLISLCLCSSSIIINNRLFKNKVTKVLNIISLFISIIIVVGRFISGVHWVTDILGGVLISSFLLMLFYLMLDIFKK